MNNIVWAGVFMVIPILVLVCVAIIGQNRRKAAGTALMAAFPERLIFSDHYFAEKSSNRLSWDIYRLSDLKHQFTVEGDRNRLALMSRLDEEYKKTRNITKCP